MVMTEGDRETRLAQARALVAHLEAGDDAAADALIREISALQESALFQELGRITRELHEAINGFLLDARLQEIVNHEIPDATERLRYVITMTEQAANTTLNAVEASAPMVEALQDQALRLSGAWRRFQDRQLRVEEFRLLVRELEDFLTAVRDDGGQLQDRLSEVLMAQGFQDLTGQIIRRVITLVHDVEDKLVQLIRISSPRVTGVAGAPLLPHAEAFLSGPVVPGLDTQDVVQGQDAVDDLLSSLGF